MPFHCMMTAEKGAYLCVLGITMLMDKGEKGYFCLYRDKHISVFFVVHINATDAIKRVSCIKSI